MKVPIIVLLLLLVIKLCTSLHSIVDYNVNGTVSELFPWMVVLTNLTSDVVAYGTLIHKRAILTMKYNITENLPKLHVRAGCYTELFDCIPLHKISKSCSQIRDISEYSLIDLNEKYARQIIMIIIVSHPFEFNEKVNVVPEFHPDLQFDKSLDCYSLSLRMVQNSKNNMCAVLFLPIPLAIRSYMLYSPYLSHQKNITDNLLGTEIFENYPNGYKDVVYGTPLICKSNHASDQWALVGLADICLETVKNPQISKLIVKGRILITAFVSYIIENILEDYPFMRS